MNRFKLIAASFCLTLVGLAAPGTACAEPAPDASLFTVLDRADGALERVMASADPRDMGVVGVMANAEGALDRVISADATLQTRIVKAYHARDHHNPTLAAIDRASYGSAPLYRLLEPTDAPQVAMR